MPSRSRSPLRSPLRSSPLEPRPHSAATRSGTCSVRSSPSRAPFSSTELRESSNTMTDTIKTSGVDTAAPVDRTYRDASLPVEERVENLLSQMTLEEKAGLFFQTMITMSQDGELAPADPMFGLPSNEDYVIGKGMTHFNVLGSAPTAELMAQWHNKLQELAASTRLGIPVTISTDPRHSFS